MKDFIEKVSKEDLGKIETSVPIKNLTTYRVGGVASVLFTPKDIKSLSNAIIYLKDNSIKFKIIGRGSNLLFSSKLYDGVLIKLDNLNHIDFLPYNKVVVGAGVSLLKLSNEICKRGLTDFEFASGIPGSVGGAIYMNAGAYNLDMGYVVREVKVLTPSNQIITLVNKELNFHYRDSFFQHNPGYVILEASIRLYNGKEEAIRQVIKERRDRRVLSQPLEYPSAGSVFRNPVGNFAGKLVEEAGLKGYMIGGAQVSEKHANFIINKNNASAEDIYNLIEHVKKEVFNKFGIELRCEQEKVNWE
jgi:UDP-N-acetylmuramate dehydrogenase